MTRPSIVALASAAAVAAPLAASFACSRVTVGPGAGNPGATQGPLALSDVITGLGATTDLAFLPDGSIVLTEKDGAVKVARPGGAVALAGTFDVDADGEKGLLGVAVDPDFATTRRLFFYYSRSTASGGTDLDRNRVVSGILGVDGKLALGQDGKLESALKVLVSGLRGPANHDGGALAVGPDGKLYVGVGDSGCNTGAPPEPPRTPDNFFATCLSNANGKILRVNLDGTPAADNLLANVASATACGDACGAAIGAALAPPRPEIWAWGFRNPWRFWFDPQTGLLWVGDVGEASYEEIDVAVAGHHHGWPWREGPHGWPASKCREVVPDTGDCVDPVYHCRHGAAANGIDGDCESITGGVIVDATAWPASERGRYYFADNVTGQVWSLAVSPDRLSVQPGSRREVVRFASGAPVSLRLGPDGDLYIAVLPGRIVKLAPASGG